MTVCVASLSLWFLYVFALGAYFFFDLHRPETIAGLVASVVLLVGAMLALLFGLCVFGRRYTHHLE